MMIFLAYNEKIPKLHNNPYIWNNTTGAYSF